MSGLFETVVALLLGLYSSSSKRDVTKSRGEVSGVTFTIRVFRPKACVVICCQQTPREAEGVWSKDVV